MPVPTLPSGSCRQATAAHTWPRAQLGERGIAHAAAVNLLNASGRAELVRDVQLMASDTGRDSPQTEGKKAEKSGLRDKQGIWHEELSLWKTK